MNVHGRVVAVVGPNEAGKTSLLRALEHLRAGRDFLDSEWTRGQPRPTGDIVWARFLLEADDRQAIGLSKDETDARWYVLFKTANGVLRHRIEPADALRRDISPRKRVRQDLERAATHKVFRDSTDDDQALITDRLRSAADALDTSAETLEDESIDVLESTNVSLEQLSLEDNAPKYIKELPSTVQRLIEHERQEHPRAHALSVLDTRHPTFLLFGEDERDLRSDYNLLDVADDPPVALANLAGLGNLDLAALRDAQVAGRYPEGEKLVEDANAELKERFDQAWKQSGVFLRLSTDETTLRIFVATVKGYSDIAERSDGLLAFIALLTFTALHSRGRRVILLIDEAENHLHYDAQADLVRVFTRQQAADKVIYTTHSAGCLPNDLGAVRLVAAHEDGTSSITNAYWAGGPGLSPLLVGMGASVLAFTPARRAVFAEGGADTLLLPALLREAADKAELDFQVVPGLSEVRPIDVPDLDLDAAVVAYHVDGDKGGTRIRRKLIQAGVPEDRIVTLGGKNSRLVVEDLVETSVYLEAVNGVIERSNSGVPSMPKSRLSARDRPSAVRAWCSAHGVDEPNKAAVAYEVLELLTRGRPVLAAKHRQLARSIHQRFATLLRLDDDDRGQ